MSNPQSQIYLASSSPRRQILLEQIGIHYKLLQPEITETPQPQESPTDYATRIALEKALSGLELLNNSSPALPLLPVLAADTVVSLKNRIFGKPKNRADAINMLEQLSGKSHDVITAVALVTNNTQHSTVCKSCVTFRQISRKECEEYWLTSEPHDKAGGYAIQGKGAVFISHLSGSYSGVMGLPLFETSNILKILDIEINQLNV